MENKQLENEDLLMNKKEELIWKVIADNINKSKQLILI